MDCTVEEIYAQYVENACTHFWYRKGLWIVDMSKNETDYTLYYDNGEWDIAQATDIVRGEKVK